MAVFEEMGLEHRLCVIHLYANCRAKFGGGTIIRDLMMGASKATYYQEWERKMNELKAIDRKCWEWLMGVDTKYWCKHTFPHFLKCDIVMNNLAEGFNSTILTARDKPIITMCEWIREYLMTRIAKQRMKLEAWPHRIMPKPRKRLNKEIEASANWYAMWTGQGLEFQIHHIYDGRGYCVDLKKMTCSCNFWQLVGIPCRHACSAIADRILKPEDFVDPCYSRFSYELAYGHGISAINGKEMWPIVEVDDMLPPNFKRGPGRPKKLRRRQPQEETNAKKLKRTGTSYKCTKCDKFGHNSRSCKSTEVNPEAQKRKRKPKKTTATDAATVSATDAATDVATASAANTASGPTANDAATASAANIASGSASGFISANVAGSATANVAGSSVSASATATATVVASATANVTGSANPNVAGSSVSASARMPYKQPKQRPPKIAVKRTRFSTRVRRSVLPATGPGSDPNQPLQIEDNYTDGCVTQEAPN